MRYLTGFASKLYNDLASKLASQGTSWGVQRTNRFQFEMKNAK
jgi:hypothetical protein